MYQIKFLVEVISLTYECKQSHRFFFAHEASASVGFPRVARIMTLRDLFDTVRSLHTIIDGPIGGTDTTTNSPPPSSTNMESPPLSMELIMPIDRWTKMSNRERNHFLDQFYPIKAKYRMHREADENCANFELDLYKCQKDGRIKWNNVWDKSKPLKERLDACALYEEKLHKCVEFSLVRILYFWL